MFRLGAIPSTIPLGTSGLAGGLQAGYNWQFGSFVLGGEISFTSIGQQATITTTITRPGVQPITTSALRSIDRLYTVRARAGVAILPQVMLYGTGGFAAADGRNFFSVVAPAAGPPMNATTSSDLKTGWTAGFGGEWALTRSVSFKVEYLHYDLGSTTQTVNYAYGGNRSSLTMSVRDAGDLVQAGFNFKF